jgi:hypothetical protein
MSSKNTGKERKRETERDSEKITLRRKNLKRERGG